MEQVETVTDLTKGVYRRLYSGFTKGQRINKLSLQAEAWFWRITAAADDFGNADAEPGLCLAATVGRRAGITPSHVVKWLEEMRESGLIQMYADESGDKYLHINGFEELQPAGKNGRRVRRFPPCESEGIQGNPRVVSASYSYSDPHSDTDTESSSNAPDFLTSLKTNPAYSHVNLDIETNKMQAWLSLPANKGRKLTPRFVLNWLNKIERPLTVNGNGSRAPVRYVANDAAEVCSRCFNTGTESTPTGSRICDHQEPV